MLERRDLDYVLLLHFQILSFRDDLSVLGIEFTTQKTEEFVRGIESSASVVGLGPGDEDRGALPLYHQPVLTQGRTVERERVLTIGLSDDDFPLSGCDIRVVIGKRSHSGDLFQVGRELTHGRQFRRLGLTGKDDPVVSPPVAVKNRVRGRCGRSQHQGGQDGQKNLFHNQGLSVVTICVS